MPRIPDLPGDAVPTQHAVFLRRCVADVCETNSIKFPGSQPVSFSQQDLARLENENYWVCEKSDGIRVLMFIHTDLETKAQAVYIIDRHNAFRELSGFYFPHHENPRDPLRNTIIDGELVLDVDPRSNQETLRFLAFDCLAVDGQNVMARSLDKRYGRLKEFFLKPYTKMMRDHPHLSREQCFDIQVKVMEFAYGIEKVLYEYMPRLQHGSDGLIYTCAQSPYVMGTDPKILKWKPPSENSIDFKLSLRFPPQKGQLSEPDFFAKPVFVLMVYTGGRDHNEEYEIYDELFVDDDEWERLKESGEQVDDRVVEVHWEPSANRWRLMRFRDDKPNGNYKTVVDAIIQSIMDGVEKEDLLARTNAIRVAWKARASHQASNASIRGGSQQQPTSRPPPQAPLLPAQSQDISKVQLRYGPLQQSPYSKVGGPLELFGFLR